MADRPVEILALSPKLHELFDGLVPQKANGDVAQNELDFLSRALAAYAMHKLAGATIAEAANAIVDGGNDGGIDCSYISAETNTLWLIQSKYTDDGMSEPGLQEVGRFASGVEDLMAQRFEEFRLNLSWQPLLPRVEAHLKKSGARVQAVLCYSGLRLISEDRKLRFDALKVKVSNDADDDFLDSSRSTLPP